MLLPENRTSNIAELHQKPSHFLFGLRRINSPLSIALLFFTSSIATTAMAGVGEGQELYEAYCTVCHGGLGEGRPMDKPLTDGNANRLEDEALLQVITEGRAGTGMAAWGSNFSAEEIFDIASYVRTLQGRQGLSLDDGAAGLSDDPLVLAGEELFNGEAQCSTCHAYRGKGGNVGPPLDGVSADIPPTGLANALLNPSARITEGYETKQVETNDGTIIRGRFRNETDQTVQLQSADGKRWVTYFKDRVKSVADVNESLMPAVYGDMTTEQQEQLMAFLNSL